MEKRDKLLARKIEVDAKLSEARIDLSEAKRIAYVERKFLPPRTLTKMERDLAALQRESQRIQFELRGERKEIHAAKDQKGALFMQEFFMVARTKLTKDQFKEIVGETEARLNRQHRKNTEIKGAEDGSEPSTRDGRAGPEWSHENDLVG